MTWREVVFVKDEDYLDRIDWAILALFAWITLCWAGALVWILYLIWDWQT